MNASIKPDDFREAMRLTASGVAVITTHGEAGMAGVTVSTFQSFSIDPPSVLACIHCESRNLQTILKNGNFAANVLAAIAAQILPHISFVPDQPGSAHQERPSRRRFRGRLARNAVRAKGGFRGTMKVRRSDITGRMISVSTILHGPS